MAQPPQQPPQQPPGNYPPQPGGPPGYPQQSYGQQPYYGQPYVREQGNGIAVAGGVTGIVSLVIAFIPFIDFLSIPGGIAAIILGIVGINRASQMGGTGRGMAITGIVTGAITIVIVIIFVALVYSYFATHVNNLTFPSFTPFPT